MKRLCGRRDFILSVLIFPMTRHGLRLGNIFLIDYIFLPNRWSLNSWKPKPREERRDAFLGHRSLLDNHVVDLLEAQHTVAQEERDEESDQPSDPDVAPVILIAVDTRERVDDAQTDEAEDEERTEQGSAAQIDHVVDVARGEDRRVTGECSVERRESEPRIPQLVGTAEVAGEMWRRRRRVLQRRCAGVDGDVAQRKEVRPLVAGHQLDRVDEDLRHQRPTQKHRNESQKSPREEVDLALAAVRVHRLPRPGREQPEHHLSNEHDERRQNEAKAVEKRIGDVDVEVLRHVIRLVQMHISAVEYTVMEWKYCGES